MKKYTINNTNLYVSKFLPPKGFIALALFGTILYREEFEYRLTDEKYRSDVLRTIRHEGIHKAQMQDFCKWIPVGGTIFYLCYFFEWIFRVFQYGFKDAYYNISFEREAFDNDKILNYLPIRVKFAAWKKYLKKQ
jgi:hypothetical protein